MTDNRKSDNRLLYPFRLKMTDKEEYETLEGWIAEKMESGSVKRGTAIYQIVVALIQKYAKIKPKPVTKEYTEEDIRNIAISAVEDRYNVLRDMIEQIASDPSRVQKLNQLTEQYQSNNGEYDEDTMNSLLADFEERE
jgi:hypothetical protein